MSAVENIINKIGVKYPNSKELIKPVLFVEKNDLKINKEISIAFSELVSIRKVGSQYEWLAQFCNNYDFKKVEISVERNLDLCSFGNFIKYNYLDVNSSDISNKKLYNTIDTVFKYFDFPIIDLLKTDMLAITEENQWEEIMYLTWFCHKPKNN